MSFSARQLHCLDAMGIVAWTNGTTIGDTTASESSDNLVVADVLQVPIANPAADAVLTQQHSPWSKEEGVPMTAMPSAIDQLAQWLVRQPLTPMMYKGRQTSCIGSESASLLVICLYVGESAPLPLSRESAQLFDLMMRAIEMPRTSFRQCAMPSCTSKQTQDTAASVYPEDIFTPHTRAVLVLDPMVSADSEVSRLNTIALPSSSVPLWRAPHPDLLLETPALKRQAWEVLKGLRQVLG